MQVSLGKRVLSYLYPLILKRVTSSYSGLLEIGLQNGKLILDSPNANYSFGNLHTIFQKAIKKLNLSKEKNYRTLILGFGVGSIARILNEKKNHQFNITGIEVDKVVIDIGKTFFDTDKIKNCTVIEQDADEYLKSTDEKYDLIFIDLFIDTQVPSHFRSEMFLEKMKELLLPKGTILMNIMDIKQDKDFKQKWESIFEAKGHTAVYKFLDTNHVFIFNKN